MEVDAAMSKGHRSKLKRQSRSLIKSMGQYEVTPHKWPRYNKVVGSAPGVAQKARSETAVHEQKLREAARLRRA